MICSTWLKLTVKGVSRILNIILFHSDLPKAYQVFVSLIGFVRNCSKIPSKKPFSYFIPRMISLRVIFLVNARLNEPRGTSLTW